MIRKEELGVNRFIVKPAMQRVLKKAFVIFVILLFMLWMPFDINSNTGIVRAAPEAYKFEDYSKGSSVDLSTGDMTMKVPLFTVPGVAGLDYPLVMTYHAGIKQDQQASWVGLGWDLGVDSISRQANFVPDDYYYENSGDTYRQVNNYPPTYPTSKFKQQTDQMKAAQSKARMNQAVGLGISIALGVATGGAGFLATTSFATSMMSSAIHGAMNEAEMAKSMDELIAQQDAIKNQLDLTSEDVVGEQADGFIYSDAADDGDVDFYSPDTYFVSSHVYSGPLSLIKTMDESSAEVFIPLTYSYGKEQIDFSSGTDTDIPAINGYSKNYYQAKTTDVSFRLIADIDEQQTGDDETGPTTLDGFEFVDESGMHYLFSEPVERYIPVAEGEHRTALANFVPSNFSVINEWRIRVRNFRPRGWAVEYGEDLVKSLPESGSIPEDFVEFTWTNAYAGGILNSMGRYSTCERYLEIGDMRATERVDFPQGCDLYFDDHGILGSWTVLRVPYTSSWGITAIHTPSYKDEGNRGHFGLADSGGWIKFNYVDEPELSHGVYTFSNSQRVCAEEMCVGDSSRYYNLDEDFDVSPDGKKFASRTFKTFKYLESIETPTHIAEFQTSDRNDGREVYAPDGDFDSFPKLDAIVLKKKRVDEDIGDVSTNENPFEIEKYVFDYDYSLAYGAPDNILYAQGECSADDWEDCGRLTLKSLTYYYCSAHNNRGVCTQWNGLPPFDFEYANDAEPVIENICTGAEGCNQYTRASQCVLVDGCSLNEDVFNTGNPRYVKDAYDIWGYAYYSPGNRALHNGNALNLHNNGRNLNPNVDSWSLTKVNWPTGGTTEWEYQEDRYIKLNDYVVGLGRVGGGLRVGSLTHCAGQDNCYTSHYKYTTQSLQEAVDNEFVGPMTSSSGVATGVPPYPIYSPDFKQVFSPLERLLVKAGSPGVMYSQVITYLDDGSQEYPAGFTEHYFTTPMSEPGTASTNENEQYAAGGTYTPRTTFNKYHLTNAGDSPNNIDGLPIGADFVIKEGIGDNDVDTLLVGHRKKYLVTAKEQGYLFFLQTLSGSNERGGGTCRNIVAVQHFFLPAITELCPGSGSVYCGTVGLFRVDIEGDWNYKHNCGEPGNIIVFCSKSNLDDSGDSGVLIDDDGNTVRGWRDLVRAGLKIGNHGAGGGDAEVEWGLIPWQDHCSFIYGGDNADWNTDQRWEFSDDPYVDGDCFSGGGNPGVCDILENDISINKIIPSFKYGLNYMTRSYSSDVELISQVENEYSFTENRFKRGGLLTGAVHLTKTTATQDGVTTVAEYNNFDKYTGQPMRVREYLIDEEHRDDGKVRETTIELAYEGTGDIYESFDKDAYHMLNAPRITTIKDCLPPPDTDRDRPCYVSATRVDYDLFEGVPLVKSNYVWTDVGGRNENKIDRSDRYSVDREWQKTSEVTEFELKYFRPVVVEDALGRDTTTLYSSPVDGACSDGTEGIYPTCVIDALGNEVKSVYDDFGRVETIIDANDQLTTFEYDDKGRLWKIYKPDVDEPGEAEELASVEYHYIYGRDYNHIADYLNSVGAWARYGDNNNQRSFSRTWTDGLGRQLQTVSHIGPGNNHIVSGTNEYEEGTGRLIKTYKPIETDSGGYYTPLDEFDGNPHAFTEYENDPLGRVHRVYPPADSDYDEDAYVETEYGRVNIAGKHYFKTRVTTTVDSENIETVQTTSYIDKFGNLIAVIDTAGEYWGYGYDILGRLTLIATPADDENNIARREITTEYDKLGRVTETNHPDTGGTERYVYDLNNNLLYFSTEKGRYKFTYDELNRKLTDEFSENPEELPLEPDDDDGTYGVKIKYFYDGEGQECLNGNEFAAGKLCAVYKGNALDERDLEGTTTSYRQFGYDNRGRMIEEEVGIRVNEDEFLIYNIVYTYDNIGNLKTETISGDGISEPLTTRYSYDRLSRLVDVKFQKQGEDEVTIADEFNYNPEGTIESFRQGNQIVTAYEYTARDWLKGLGIGTEDDDSSIFQRAYGYDKIGNLLRLYGDKDANIDRDNNLLARFQYDPLDRLTDVTNLGDYYKHKTGEEESVLDSYSFEYDVLGNRREKTIAIDDDLQVQYGYSYENDNNQLTGVSCSPSRDVVCADNTNEMHYDAVGNLVCLGDVDDDGACAEGETGYEYDYFNNMMTKTYLSQCNLDDDGCQPDIEYVYDEGNRRVIKKEDDMTTYYIYNSGGQVVFELCQGEGCFEGEWLATDFDWDRNNFIIQDYSRRNLMAVDQNGMMMIKGSIIDEEPEEDDVPDFVVNVGAGDVKAVLDGVTGNLYLAGGLNENADTEDLNNARAEFRIQAVNEEGNYADVAWFDDAGSLFLKSGIIENADENLNPE